MTAEPLVSGEPLEEVYLRQAATPDWGEHWAGPPQLVDEIVRAADTRATDLVLDVGCGLGGPARRLVAQAGCRVVALDLLEPLLRRALRRSRGGRVPHYLAASAETLPFAANAFDQVWVLGVTGHIPDLALFARSAYRVLRADGVLCVSEPFWDGQGAPRFARSAPVPWRPLTLPAFEAALAEAGFRRVVVLPWPGRAYAPEERIRIRDLREDVLDGRLTPALVLGRKTG